MKRDEKTAQFSSRKSSESAGDIEAEKHYYIAALSRVSAAIAGLRDLDTILKIGLDNVVDIINGDVGGIMLLDAQKKTLTYCVYHELSKEYIDEMCIYLGEGIAGKVAQSGKPKLVEDISKEPNVAHPSIIASMGLKAFVSVPLQSKGTVLGVMNVASYTPRRFTKTDMFLLNSIGDQLGIAIEQTKLYEQLRKSRERYRQLAQQILIAQEEERRRIARELHDETSQSLSGLALNLQALVEMGEIIKITDKEFKTKLNKAQSLAVQIGAEVSRLIADLRPTLLDTLGLIPAIRHYAETNLLPAGIKIVFKFDVEEISLPPEMEAGLFRITQGTISNIIHHAEAKKVTIAVKYQDNELLLHISDDGKGFDVDQITHIEESGRGAGLFSMKERTRLMGGRCSIDSQVGKGTKVNVLVPLNGGSADAKDKSPSG
jgi:signal transduction histidine kinase